MLEMEQVNDINRRIRLLRKDDLKLSQEEFANRINLSQRAVSTMETSGSRVTDRNLKTICEKFNVNEKWLRTGEGEMFAVQNDDPMDAIVNKYQLAPDERVIVETYLQFPPEGRQKILDFITQCAERIREYKKAGVPLPMINVNSLLEPTFRPIVTVNELNNAIDELTRIRNHKLEQQSSASQPTESENNSPKIKAQKS